MSTSDKTKKTVVGQVIGDKMNKTIVVSADRFMEHPRYRKYIKRSTHYKAHDELNEASEGDKVLIEESRPLSKSKRWRLVRVMEKAFKE